MASLLNATDVVVRIDNVVVGCAQSVDITVSRALDPATCSASGGWAQSSPGERSWSGSIGAVARTFETGEEAANISYDDLLTILTDGTKVELEFSLGTTKRYGGFAYVSELAFSKPETGVCTWNASFTGDGEYAPVTA